MKYAAISLNLDSLNWLYGFPGQYRDPCFFEIMDRFFALSSKWNFKYSIYVIGKDLENPQNRLAVKSWSDQGHEIGNHSWSHSFDLAALNKKQIFDEIKKAHDILTATTGIEPKGFISPLWSSSSLLRQVLMELGYEYDTSTFPSLFMYPLLLKIMINHGGFNNFKKIIHRKDLLYPLLASRRSKLLRWKNLSLVSLPVPTNKFRLACWHTTAFTFGWKFHKRLLEQCLKETDAFYYLIHPADLVVPKDLDNNRKTPWERLAYPREYKIEIMEKAMAIIKSSGRKLVSMQELARLTANKSDV